MMKKFLIYAPPYDPNTGGIIALHKLCDLINRAGRHASLYPMMPSLEIHAHNLRVAQAIPGYFNAQIEAAKNFQTNPELITPVIFPDLDDTAGADLCVVYPEIIFGNPLRAKNVVRWMLHRPGHLTGQIYFSKNELHFYYTQAFREYDIPFCKTSELQLMIEHAPYQLYLENDPDRVRSGTAYCIRKGKGRPMQHDLADSTLIDGKSHEEISEILKGVKTFISYDIWTTYIRLAVLAGCDVVVIPQEGISKEQCMPEANYRHGIAYGFDALEEARATRHLAIDNFTHQSEANVRVTETFLAEVDAYFGGSGRQSGQQNFEREPAPA